jgi:hypothetical protein
MPIVDVEAERRARMRALAKSRKLGDFITCDAPPAVSMMVVDGKLTAMRPPPSADELRAEADRWWKRSCGPW